MVSKQVYFETLPSSLYLLVHQHILARPILLAMVVTAQQKCNKSSFRVQFSNVVPPARPLSNFGANFAKALEVLADSPCMSCNMTCPHSLVVASKQGFWVCKLGPLLWPCQCVRVCWLSWPCMQMRAAVQAQSRCFCVQEPLQVSHGRAVGAACTVACDFEWSAGRHVSPKSRGRLCKVVPTTTHVMLVRALH